MQRFAAGLLTIVTGLALLGVFAEAPQAEAQTPTPIMPLDEVRVGMKGYGKTVFHGDKIEPFGFEVVSVISDSSAKRATIWVICSDERMQRSGPVQGMSGSPMYVWDEGEEGEIGEGGRLIGAFAFGYSEVNVCLVGVQPIGYMREVGGRAVAEDLEEPLARQVAPGTAERSLAALQASADQQQRPASHRLLLDATRQTFQNIALSGGYPSVVSSRNETTTKLPAGMDGRALPMYLPMSVGDAQTAQLLAPLLEPAGITAMAGGLTQVAGKPPSNVDPERVKLEPGSVLSIPLAFGDVDLNAAGTVTDVIPDGTVLAFGHAMNAIGSSRLPMGTGYTHFVVSRDSISFKLGSTLDIVGSIVRDEASAVAGVAEQAFFTSPVTVHVEMPDQPARDYQYQIVDDPQMTAGILGAVVNASLTAVQAPPAMHMLTATGKLEFTGGRTFNIDAIIPNGGMDGLAYEMLTPVIAMMQNPFDSLQLESADVSIKIDQGIAFSAITQARLEQAIVQPGDTLRVVATLQPFEGQAYTRTLDFELPTDLPEGEYQIMVGGPEGQTYRMLSGRPDLHAPQNVDELLEKLQAISAVPRKSIYLAVPRLKPGLSINGKPLPDLPSSRTAVLGATASSTLMPYPLFIEQSYPTEQFIGGEIGLNFRVQHAAP